MTNRRSFLASGAAALAAPLLRSAPARRNVLFIASDDLNNCIGAYGHPIVRTPNLDRLARAGVRVGRAYCHFPLCSPSRSSIMTGLAPDTTRVWNLQTHFREALPDVVTLPQLFQNNGYFTARAGKIYHYGVPGGIGTAGLDDPPSWNETVNPNGVDHTDEEKLLTNYTPTRGLGAAIAYHASASPDNRHTDSIVADAVIAMMEKRRADPWFLGAGFYRPHVPWIAPSKYFDLYPMSRIEAPRFDESEMSVAPEWAYFTRPANWDMTVLQRREAIRAYYASISFMDVQVGRVLDALDRLNLTQNTSIVFWSDHGYQLGEHGQWMKQSLFEPSARAPLLIGGAGVSARNRPSRRTVELLDLYPTIAGLCALEGAPTNLHGRSLTPLLRDANARWDKPAVTQVYRPRAGNPIMGYSLRTERHRYTFWNEGAEGEELYDYEKDPREMRNLSSDPASAALKQKLRSTLQTTISSRR
jgi:iduronate 2-sulfatase